MAGFFSIVLHRTLYGRSVLAIGQNMRAAWLAGITGGAGPLCDHYTSSAPCWPASAGFCWPASPAAHPWTWASEYLLGLDRRGRHRRNLGGRRKVQRPRHLGGGAVSCSSSSPCSTPSAPAAGIAADPDRPDHRRRHHNVAGGDKTSALNGQGSEQMALVGDSYEYYDKRFHDLTVPIAEVEELYQRLPVGRRAGLVQRWQATLVWSDIPNRRLLRWVPGQGVTVFRAEIPISPTAIPATGRGRLVTCRTRRPVV